MKGRVLVAGFATRHVAASAVRAGYEVHAIDAFCDRDLSWLTKSCKSFEELDELPGLVQEVCEKIPVDIFVVTSGAEDMETGRSVCGTPPGKAREFTDKNSIQNFFEEIDAPVPGILGGGLYPAMLKPCHGAGGWRNQIVSSEKEEEGFREMWPDVPYIRQEVVEGVPCSVSCIAADGQAKAVAANMQYMRGGDGERAYGFAGAATPYLRGEAAGLFGEAERIVSLSGCTGSVGVDFMLCDDGISAIEINPRFQATLDIVEMSMDFNIFRAHVEAAGGILPKSRPEAKRFAARKVLFADRDLTVRDDLGSLCPRVADIPWKGTEIEEGSAVISAYGLGATMEATAESLDKTIKEIGGYISRW